MAPQTKPKAKYRPFREDYVHIPPTFVKSLKDEKVKLLFYPMLPDLRDSIAF
jgi:hypothetical protein